MHTGLQMEKVQLVVDPYHLGIIILGIFEVNNTYSMKFLAPAVEPRLIICSKICLIFCSYFFKIVKQVKKYAINAVEKNFRKYFFIHFILLKKNTTKSQIHI